MRKFKTKLLFPLIAAGTLVCGMSVSANTGIERSSTGFTTDRYNLNIYDGEQGEEVFFQPVIPEKIAGKGQHLYAAETNEDITVSKWTLEYAEHTCIHTDYPDDNRNEWEGFSFNRHTCFRLCQPGWIATCAKCGREIGILFYSTRDTISQLRTLPIHDAYVSNCVYQDCNNLEQGTGIGHKCDDISWNRYKVLYHNNGANGGYIPASLHYYNNETTYEGQAVDPQKKLTANTYYRIGYAFDGWNTKEDGSGISFSDEEKFLNIQNLLNLGNDDEDKEIHLYAQWKPASSTLVIDPNGGTYDGETAITQRFRSVYTLDSDKLTPPAGATVTYNTQGGNAVAPTHTTMHFNEWTFASPMYGLYNNDYKQYLFGKYDTNNIYSSGAQGGWHDGCVDTVIAQYAGDSFKLPNATYPSGDRHFGGWYADPECTIFIGGAGDDFYTDKDVTLYAKWSTLHLDSKENWTANNGKGAVDLSWIQNDNADKVFKVYQKKENGGWVEVKSATNITNNLGNVSKTFTRNTDAANSEQTFTAPYSGLYNFTLYGAQGGNSGSFTGGKGGKVTGRVYLNEGETVTIGVGSQDGKGSKYIGGTASDFGCGGSASYISVKRLGGTIAVAGGGGGATKYKAGIDAGAGEVRTDTTDGNGQNGMAGGGGGLTGGKKGEAVFHHHDKDGNVCTVQKNATIPSNSVIDKKVCVEHDDEKDWYDHYIGTAFIGDEDDPLRKPSLLRFSGVQAWHYSSGNYGGKNGILEDLSLNKGLTIKNQNDAELLHVTFQDIRNYVLNVTRIAGHQTDCFTVLHPEEENRGEYYERFVFSSPTSARYESGDGQLESNFNDFFLPGTWHSGGGNYGEKIFTYNYEVKLDTSTTAINITFENCIQGHPPVSAPASGIIQAVVTDMVCGKEEGEKISETSANGGSNGFPDNAKSYIYFATTQAGVQTGNGSITIAGAELGAFKDNYLNGVRATDEAAPNVPVLKRKTAEDDNNYSKATIVWSNPGDNGTTYQHQVKSFYTSSMAPMLESNITTDVITSGVKGYRVVIDGSANTTVNATNSSYQTANSYTVTGLNKSSVKYIHVAAVDGAGNIGETTHLKVGANAGDQIYYPVETTPIVIKGLNNNVYKKDNSYFVKADGETPFYLSTNGLISEVGDAVPSQNYQVNMLAYNISDGGAKQKMNYYRQNDGSDISKIGIDGVRRSVEGVTGSSYFGDYPFFEMNRYNGLRNLSINAAYTIDAAYNNVKLRVTPQAAAYQTTDKYNNSTYTYSNDAADERNSIDLIADGKAPVISGDGYDFLKDTDNIDIGEYPDNYTITIDAKDDESGLKEFYVVIENEDNRKTQTFTGNISGDGKSGTVTINITDDDLLFRGDINFLIYASDNVGNETEDSRGLGEFGLHTMLASQNSDDVYGDNGYIIFKKGETGVLIVRTSGYADQLQVKFPNDFAVSGFETTKNFYYEKPIGGGETNEDDLRRFGIRTEIIRFPIPYDIEEKDAYDIEITAFKNGDSITVNEGIGLRTLSEHQKFNIEGSILDNIRTYIIQN